MARNRRCRRQTLRRPTMKRLTTMRSMRVRRSQPQRRQRRSGWSADRLCRVRTGGGLLVRPERIAHHRPRLRRFDSWREQLSTTSAVRYRSRFALSWRISLVTRSWEHPAGRRRTWRSRSPSSSMLRCPSTSGGCRSPLPSTSPARLGRRVIRGHLLGDVSFGGFGGRFRKSDRHGNAWRRHSDEGRGVVDALADRIDEIGGTSQGRAGDQPGRRGFPRRDLRS